MAVCKNVGLAGTFPRSLSMRTFAAAPSPHSVIRRNPAAHLLPQLCWCQCQGTLPGLADEGEDRPPRVWALAVRAPAASEVQSYALDGQRREVRHGFEKTRKGPWTMSQTRCTSLLRQLSMRSHECSWLPAPMLKTLSRPG